MGYESERGAHFHILNPHALFEYSLGLGEKGYRKKSKTTSQDTTTDNNSVRKGWARARKSGRNRQKALSRRDGSWEGGEKKPFKGARARRGELLDYDGGGS